MCAILNPAVLKVSQHLSITVSRSLRPKLMIAVTRLDGSAILLNDDLIESIEQTPDTMLLLVNGHKVLVRDAPDQLVQRIVEFRRAISRDGRVDDAGSLR